MSPSRSSYKTWLAIPTRWEDFDAYGHVNNVKYYAYFDTAINEYLIHVGGLDPKRHPIVAYVVSSRCTFSGSFSFPEIIDAGLAVTKLGTSSVTYRIALFREGETTPRATGEVVHVFVDREKEIAVPIPDTMRQALRQVLTTQP